MGHGNRQTKRTKDIVRATQTHSHIHKYIWTHVSRVGGEKWASWVWPGTIKRCQFKAPRWRRILSDASYNAIVSSERALTSRLRLPFVTCCIRVSPRIYIYTYVDIGICICIYKCNIRTRLQTSRSDIRAGWWTKDFTTPPHMEHNNWATRRV